MKLIPRRGNRGQMWTFDALLMLALMIGGIVFAAQLLPVHDSRTVANDFVEAQLEQDASDLLAITATTGTLQNATVYWNDSTGRWVDTDSSGVYTRVPPGHPLHEPLSTVFDQNAIAYNIDIVYQTEDGDSAVHQLIYQGTPGAHGVSVSTSVIIYDDTHLTIQSDSITLKETSNFFAPDVFVNGPKYNVFQVRIIAWKY